MSEEAKNGALRELAAAVRGHYRERLVAIRSVERAAHIESEDVADLEVAVVPADGTWQPAAERRAIENLAFEIATARDLYIRPWVIAQSHWETPEQSDHPALVAELKRHASMPAFAMQSGGTRR